MLTLFALFFAGCGNSKPDDILAEFPVEDGGNSYFLSLEKAKADLPNHPDAVLVAEFSCPRPWNGLQFEKEVQCRFSYKSDGYTIRKNSTYHERTPYLGGFAENYFTSPLGFSGGGGGGF